MGSESKCNLVAYGQFGAAVGHPGETEVSEIQQVTQESRQKYKLIEKVQYTVDVYTLHCIYRHLHICAKIELKSSTNETY